MIAVPKNHHGEVFGKSGLALNCSITDHYGITDSVYQGVVCVILFNNSKVVLSGQRKGQLIIKRNMYLLYL